MSIDLSIVSPIYNGEKTVSRLLESIVNQHSKYSFEFIAVLGPSTDRTKDIIHQYEEKYDFIHGINVEYRNAGKARIDGIKAAQGDYITFADADDYYSLDAIEVMIDTIKKYDADIVVTNYQFVTKHGIRKNIFSRNRIYNQKEMLKACFKDTYVRSFFWNKVYKSNLLKERTFFSPDKHVVREDAILNLQIYLHAQKMVTIKDVVYFYDKTNESSTSSQDKTRLPWLINVFAIQRYLLKDNPEYTKMFLSLKKRRKIILFLEKCIVKNYYSKDEFKQIKKEVDHSLKLINDKHDFIVKGTQYEEVINKLINTKIK